MGDTGHAKNVEAWAILCSAVGSFGVAYNPSNALIKLSPLGTVLGTAQAALTGVNTAIGAEKTAISDREATFKGIRTLTSRIVDAFEAAGASEQLMEDARSFKRKIDGTRAKTITPVDPNAPPDPNAPHNISAAQTSYVQLVEHFDGLIQLVTSSGVYTPNETDLKLPALNAQLNDGYKAANQSVIDTGTDTDTARIARNHVLYDPETGLVHLASLVKKYVKSAFGPSSPQYKQISGLRFKNIK